MSVVLIIIIGAVIWFFVAAWSRAKSRMHFVDKLRAVREVSSGSSRLPSWMASRDKIEEFIHGVERLAEHHGVPLLVSASLLSNDKLQKLLMHYAGAMEAQGASFVEQQMAVTEKLVELHDSVE
jgi:hypothetical protein